MTRKFTKNYPIQAGKKVWNELEKITRQGYDNSTVFYDFLDAMLFTFLATTAKAEEQMGVFNHDSKFRKYDKEVIKILIEKYDNNESFKKAFAFLIDEMENNPFSDVLGSIYEARVSYGQHGQYFTPEPICKLMAKASESKKTGLNIADPACGSGRTLLAYAESNRNNTFFGKDLSPYCAKMCAINLFLNGLSGYVEQGNTLSFENIITYKIRPPFIWIYEGESPFEMKENKKKIEKQVFQAEKGSNQLIMF